eukprot:301173-Rhodomonas_salina.2
MYPLVQCPRHVAARNAPAGHVAARTAPLSHLSVQRAGHVKAKCTAQSRLGTMHVTSRPEMHPRVTSRYRPGRPRS